MITLSKRLVVRFLFVAVAFGFAAPGESLAAGDSVRVVEGITVRYPASWSAAPKRFTNATELLNVPTEALATLNRPSGPTAVGRIMITTEQRRDHAGAVRRLGEIAAETTSPPTYLEICGWPALQRRHLAPKPQRGIRNPQEDEIEMLLRITTAVAVDSLVVRLEGSLSPDSAPEVAEQVELIGRSLACTATGNAQQIQEEIEGLRKAPSPSASLRAPQPLAPSPSAEAAGGASSAAGGGAAAPPPGATQRVLKDYDLGEIEMAVSDNGEDIVIAVQRRRVVSNDGGVTFPFSGTLPVPNFGDPSVAFGPDLFFLPNGGATFYLAYINKTGTCPNPATGFGCATGILVSTDGGQTFNFRSNAVVCPETGAGACFPDQEHIAVDPANSGGVNGHQVYVTWRNFDATDQDPALVCSKDDGFTWSAPLNVGSGFVPRITVGQDGFVYVIYRSGNSIMLHKFSSCVSTPPLNPQVGFPVTVATVTDVACPVPGLDRCNNGNILSSHMVAVDDADANHVYVTYATNTAAGNENIIVQDSTDGGATWPAARKVTLNAGVTGRRFMPWICTIGGKAFVSWFDRRFAVGGPTNDLTDYFCASAFRDGGGNLTTGSEVQLTQVSDPQCASGWACGVRATGDSEGCTVQPQLAGTCLTSCSGTTGSRTRCDFSDCPGPGCQCPSGEVCCTGGGCPKYGDYNGNACAAGRAYNAWVSAVSPPGIVPASTKIDTFFQSKLAGDPPDLKITKSDLPDPVVAGANLTYTIPWTNNSVTSALNVEWTDTLPASTVFVSLGLSAPGDWTCTTPAPNSPGTITCSGPFLSPGRTETATLVVRVDPSTPAGSTIVNTATVSSADSDFDPSDNSATSNTNVITQADLQMSKSGNPDPQVVAGTDLTYTLQATNQGPSDAQDVRISDPLPANTTFVSATPSSGGACSTPTPGTNGTVTCTWSGSTAPSGSHSVTIVVHVLSSAPHLSILSNIASVTSNTSDPAAGNNTAQLDTTVITRADLAATKEENPDPVDVGANIHYTIGITNDGPSDAANATITETVPAHTTFQSVSAPPGWNCVTPPVGGTGNITCTIPSLPAGDSASFTVLVRVLYVPTGTIINDAVTASSDTTDPDPSNDSSSTDTKAWFPVPLLSNLGLLACAALLMLVAARFLRRRGVPRW